MYRMCVRSSETSYTALSLTSRFKHRCRTSARVGVGYEALSCVLKGNGPHKTPFSIIQAGKVISVCISLCAFFHLSFRHCNHKPACDRMLQRHASTIIIFKSIFVKHKLIQNGLK